MKIRECLTYDDVLLEPAYSEVKSRSDIDLSVNLNTNDNFCLNFKHPIIPANMKTITGKELAIKNIMCGGLSILHRFMPIEEQLDIVKDIIDNYGNKNIGVSVGVKEEDEKNIYKFYKLGIRIICIDIAHGDSKLCVQMIEYIRKFYPEIFIIAGNVATGSGAKRLWGSGANAVKIGVGGGALCTTRIETGNGIPQLSALMDAAKARKQILEDRADSIRNSEVIDQSIQQNLYIISDGGIKNAGDLVKSLCFADMAMAGNVFAGCVETPGQIISMNGHTYKDYVGSSTHKTNHIEGVVAIVPTKGKYTEIFTKLLEGVKSGCSYQGVDNLIDLKDNPQFVKITNAGLRESHSHDVIIKG